MHVQAAAAAPRANQKNSRARIVGAAYAVSVRALADRLVTGREQRPDADFSSMGKIIFLRKIITFTGTLKIIFFKV